MNRAVFLDRDGVINAMVYNADYGLVDSPANPDEFELLPGAGALVRAINHLGLLAVVVSNQPGMAKGKYTRAVLDATTDKMRRGLAAEGARLDAVYYCLHHPEAAVAEYRQRCNCRKPKPGLLLQAAADLSIALDRSYMIGDGITDVLAGQAAGARTIFLNSRRCYICDELSRYKATPDYVAANPAEAATVLQHVESGNWELGCEIADLPGPVADRTGRFAHPDLDSLSFNTALQVPQSQFSNPKSQIPNPHSP